MDKQKNEIVNEADAELIDQTVEERQPEPVGIDAMDNVIAMGAKLEKYSEAMQLMRSIVIKQAYSSDWISHSRANEPVNMRKANLGAAGAERVACLLGFQETNWKVHEKKWSDDHKHYSFSAEADFTLGGRTIHAYSEVSTKNKFYSFANGQWKPIEDVRDDHVKKAALREVRKEGVRLWLGLRNVPLTVLQREGMDLNLVNYVNFRDAEQATGKAATAKPQEVKRGNTTEHEVTIIPDEVSDVKRSSKNQKDYIIIVDTEGVRYTMWGGANSKRVDLLMEAMAKLKMVKILYRHNGQYNTIDTVEEIKKGGK